MRLIDANGFETRIRELYCKDCERRKGMKNGKKCFVYAIGEVPCRACEIDDMLDFIEDAPTVDAAPVVHGVWVGIDDEPYEVFECSECGTTYDTVGNTWDIPNYCPNCGAKMD